MTDLKLLDNHSNITAAPSRALAPNVIDMLDTFTPEQNKAALQVLDALTRPLTVREIEGQLRRHGVPRSRAVITAASLKHLAIIAMIGPEQ